MTERKPKPDRHRPTSGTNQRPGGVVDGRNVVGVEGVSHAQSEHRPAKTEPEAGAGSDGTRRDDESESTPTKHQERHDRRTHADDAAPLSGEYGGCPHAASSPSTQASHASKPSPVRALTLMMRACGLTATMLASNAARSKSR